MPAYFHCTVQPFCSINGIDHRKVTASQCHGCNLWNPLFRVRTPVPTDAEIIPIGEELPAAITVQDRTSRRKATHLATSPDLSLGQADPERQHVNQK